MRLEYNDSPAPAGTVFSCLKRCEDLCRVMSVVVDNGDASDLAFKLEPSICVFKSCKRIGDHRKWNFKFKRHSRRGESVIYVVLPGHRQVDHAQNIVSAPNLKAR